MCHATPLTNPKTEAATLVVTLESELNYCKLLISRKLIAFLVVTRQREEIASLAGHLRLLSLKNRLDAASLTLRQKGMAPPQDLEPIRKLASPISRWVLAPVFVALTAIPYEVRSGRGHESFLQGILGTRNLVHYLFRRSLNGIGVNRG
jgi:hypothetical protein